MTNQEKIEILKKQIKDLEYMIEVYEEDEHFYDREILEDTEYEELERLQSELIELESQGC